MLTKDILLFFFYFLLSTLFTWWFVVLSPDYSGPELMILSTSIAGGKWMIQIVGAFLFMKDKAVVFVKNIGFVSFIGSCILLPYVISALAGLSNNSIFFFISLVFSVLIMVMLYHRAVIKSQVSIAWWYFWLFCLAVAIGLQLTVVFKLVQF
jgi:hypothetical protein